MELHMTKHELASLVLEAANNKKYWSDKETELKDKLIKMSREKPWEDDQYKLARLERKGSVNYSAIEVLKEIDLEQYRGSTITMWKLSKKVVLSEK